MNHAIVKFLYFTNVLFTYPTLSVWLESPLCIKYILTELQQTLEKHKYLLEFITRVSEEENYKDGSSRLGRM